MGYRYPKKLLGDEIASFSISSIVYIYRIIMYMQSLMNQKVELGITVEFSFSLNIVRRLPNGLAHGSCQNFTS
jgi:hypothetical protein